MLPNEDIVSSWCLGVGSTPRTCLVVPSQMASGEAKNREVDSVCDCDKRLGELELSKERSRKVLAEQLNAVKRRRAEKRAEQRALAQQEKLLKKHRVRMLQVPLCALTWCIVFFNIAEQAFPSLQVLVQLLPIPSCHLRLLLLLRRLLLALLLLQVPHPRRMLTPLPKEGPETVEAALVHVPFIRFVLAGSDAAVPAEENLSD
eukprot:s313_g37.t1